MTVDQLLLTYGPLGIMVLIAIYVIRELHNANKAKDKAYSDLQDKRLEDYKVLLTTLQESTAANNALNKTLEGQAELLEKLIVSPSDKRRR